MFRNPAGRDARKQGNDEGKKARRGAGRGKPGEKRFTAAQSRAQERNAKHSKHAAEAVSGAATPPRAAAWQETTGEFKVLDDRTPCIEIAKC